jgi:uncharacterized protein YceK
MKSFAILLVVAAACGTSGTVTIVSSTTPAPLKSGVQACRTAYAEYETTWRVARADELEEFVAGDPGVLEEILFYELASTPSRAEITRMREIYAIVEAFLWNAPWPVALAAADKVIEQCGEQTPRPPVA